MKNNNLLVVISGPSGVGKGVVIKELLISIKKLELAISATTRPIRAGEENGQDYYFFKNEEFDKAIHEDDFIEWCNVHGNRYGTLKKEITRINNNNKIGLVEIDTQGAEKIKHKYPEILSIFLAPPTVAVLEERLTKRGTESKGAIKKRIETANEELKRIKHYDYVVINDTISNSSKEIQFLITKSFDL